MAEYVSVLKASSSPDRLRATWEVKLTELEATQLIFAYVDESDVEEVRFTGKTGRGLCRYLAKDHHRKVILRLPSESTGKLSVGIVLHELAHALNWLDGGNNDHHGSVYVATLDRLVASEEMVGAC
jgi:predicted SprT family Zn-dependent metalloprotease